MNRYKSKTTKFAISFSIWKLAFNIPKFYKVPRVIHILTSPMSKDFFKYVLRAMKCRSDSKFFNES